MRTLLRLTAFTVLMALSFEGASQAWPARPEIGAVETVAGPDYCGRPARVLPESVSVRALAVDGEGNTYVETGLRAEGLVAWVDRLGEASTIQTGSSKGSVGRLVADGTGGVFVAAGSRIDQVGGTAGRRVVAGDVNAPSEGGESSGDGGPAESAHFSRILSMASDGAGSLYVAEEIDPRADTIRVRFVNLSAQPVSFFGGTPHEVTVPPGNIDTVAGKPGSLASADGRPARLVSLQSQPPALAASPGRLYLATYRRSSSGTRSTVRLINVGASPLRAHGITVKPGAITTVAGRGPAGWSADGGPARRAALSRIKGMAVDERGNLLLADEGNHRIRSVSQSGKISTFAGGTGKKGGFNGNGRRAKRALLNRPFDVKIGPGHRVYISDQMNGQLRFIGQSGRIEAAAGNGLHVSWDCFRGQPHVLNRLPRGIPVGVAGDALGNAFFTLRDNAQVFRALPSGRVEPFAGTVAPPRTCSPDSPCSSGDGGALKRAYLSRPGALAAHPKGGLYILESATGAVRFANSGRREMRLHGIKVGPGEIQTVVGRSPKNMGRDNPSQQSPLSGQGAISPDRHGNLYVADAGHRVVFRVDRRGRISRLTGITDSVLGGGCCEQPTGIAVDRLGNLYIADGEGSRIWFMNRASKTISVHGQRFSPGSIRPVAGTGKAGLAGDDGPALQARLQEPAALALDARRHLYILDYGEHAVRRLDPTGAISTFAGTGTPSFNGDGLKARLTALRYPTDIAVDLCGNLLIADMVNGRVRRVNLAGGCA